MIRWLLDLIYPPRCVLCHTLLDSSRETICDKCGRLVLSQPTGIRHGRQFTRCVSPLTYDGVVRDSVHRFKFGGRKFYAKSYALWMAAAVQQEIEEFDVLTWVPVSRSRKRNRGYDQGFELCRHMAELLEREEVSCLKKVRNNPKQSTLSNREGRKKNVKDAYIAVEPENFCGKRVLLVDDVITTGETLEECSRVLQRAGAKEVLCATLAHTK